MLGGRGGREAGAIPLTVIPLFWSKSRALPDDQLSWRRACMASDARAACGVVDLCLGALLCSRFDVTGRETCPWLLRYLHTRQHTIDS